MWQSRALGRSAEKKWSSRRGGVHCATFARCRGTGPVAHQGDDCLITVSSSRLGLAALLVSWVLPATAQAQWDEGLPTVRFSGWAGYQISSDVNTAGGTISLGSAPAYGASLTYAVAPEFDLELLWTIATVSAQFLSYGPSAPSTLPNNLGINYFQVGVSKSVRSGMFETFGEVTGGAVLFSPGTVRLTTGEAVPVTDTLRFAFTLGAGVRVYLVEKLALSLVVQARLLAPVYVTGGGFYAGNGGAVLVVGAGIPCVQGAFSAGLSMAL